MKQTTKKCPECGNTKLGLLPSFNLKVCINHKKFVWIPWYLEEGQKPLFGDSRGSRDK